MKVSTSVPGQVIHDEVLPARTYWHKRLSRAPYCASSIWKAVRRSTR
jgi:hypothetical protein